MEYRLCRKSSAVDTMRFGIDHKYRVSAADCMCVIYFRRTGGLPTSEIAHNSNVLLRRK